MRTHISRSRPAASHGHCCCCGGISRQSGLFRDRGFHEVLSPPGMVSPYYERVGFTRDGDRYRLTLS